LTLKDNIKVSSYIIILLRFKKNFHCQVKWMCCAIHNNVYVLTRSFIVDMIWKKREEQTELWVWCVCALSALFRTWQKY